MIQYSQNEALQNRHSFSIPVFSSHFLETDSPDDLFEFRNLNPGLFQNYFILGGGTNLLFQNDYQGLSLHPLSSGKRIIEGDTANPIVEAGASENWDEFVDWTLRQNLYGLENLSLIPGSVGAAPVQNIGAYGAEAKDVISEVFVLDLENYRCFWLPAKDCSFAYRTSVFKQEKARHWIVWKVRFQLRKTPKINLNYRGLSDLFPFDNPPSPQQVRDAIIGLRNSKLPDPQKLPNAGSFFKNPVVSNDQAKALQDRYPDMPIFPSDQPSHKKLAAGWLIEKCGLKNFRQGTVGTYEKQALVLVNHGGATGRDLVELAALIQGKVQEKFQVTLEPEVRIL